MYRALVVSGVVYLLASWVTGVLISRYGWNVRVFVVAPALSVLAAAVSPWVLSKEIGKEILYGGVVAFVAFLLTEFIWHVLSYRTGGGRTWLSSLSSYLVAVLAGVLHVYKALQQAEVKSRTTEGHCTACGYDLTGNESGVCPECGTKG